MIPVENRLDIYVSEDIPCILQKIEATLRQLESQSACQHVLTGYSLKYKNFKYAAHPQLVKDLERQLKPINGVYVNAYPPEIEAELAEAMP